MPNNQEKEAADRERVGDVGQIRPPAISLPKGGGAIKGIDEKFTVNPATGTGSLNVPIFTSPGRSNFQPQLSLSYNSGTGNGPFGMGWDLSVPSITRKTDKGIPRYWDQEDSDTFILSGAEDLVPVLEKKAGTWERKIDEDRVLDGKHYDILFFRPRIEGLFARIERWTNRTDNRDVFWRAITRDNITSIYGQSDTAKIADSTDASRIFKWLLERTYDDKGNIISYEYRSEDERRVVEDSETHHESWVHEKNRLANASYESQRYLKHVRYGNKTPYYLGNALPQIDDYLFEVVFDYGDHTYTEVELDVDGQMVKRIQCSHADDIAWPCRPDPFSSYRSGFEIRTYRLCRRVLMFHHFQELGSTPCLVRSTDFSYTENPIATKLIAATQTGYKRNADDAPYLFKSFPPIEFGYTGPHIDQQVRDVPEESLENLPIGLDNNQYKWIDLDGEGISGILTEQGGGWFYKPNLGNGEFGPMRVVTSQPSFGNLTGGNQQFLDLAGDGQLDLVVLEDPIIGFYERTDDFEWTTFRPFQSKPNINWLDPNLRFIDLNGDGHADILITEDELFVWYPSLEEAGYGEANSVHKVLDEEKGPAVVFADASESIYLADISGDGLTDIVRIRNGEICYWPNLGYGRFGAKVTMASPPFFDMPDQFNPKHIRLGDIDGTGTSDIFYLSHTIRFWYNRSGNSWSGPEELTSIPNIDNLSAISVVDLLGNGTSCLVWSSPLPGDSSRPMRYIDLMGSRKPHLLENIKNNLGAETKMTYAPSTKFYLKDKKAGKPWITRLTFPVHVVEKVETYDQISRNRFVTRHSYHHGYYDGIEREFRGFGRVDQWDTEQFAVLSASDTFPTGDNIDVSSHVPPVLTKTWFHTGAYVKGTHISKQLESEYYREGDTSLGQAGLSDEQLQAMLLDDTVLPDTIFLADGSREPYQLTPEETREACRSLKGSILRQEIYALDGTEEEDRPYSVSERNYTIELLQPEAENRYAVFFTHSRETIDFYYERKLYDINGQKHADPRVSHSMTLSVDQYGNVQQAVAISYGRRFDDPDTSLTDEDREKEKQLLITYTENQYTDSIWEDNAYRLPLQADARTYEIINVVPVNNQQYVTNLFRFEELTQKVQAACDGNHDIPYEDVSAAGAVEDHPYRRLIEHVRQLYYANDLSGPLQLKKMHSLGLPYENYKLAFNPGLIATVYERESVPLLPDDPVRILRDEGGYVLSDDYKARNWFPDEDPDGYWWIPSGQRFYSPVAENPVPPSLPEPLPQNTGFARNHFYLPQGARDPFGEIIRLAYDGYNLLLKKTEDALKNIVTVETKDDAGNDIVALDYRVMQPWAMVDPNGNSTETRFDVLGMVVGTAVKGKNNEGDLLTGFVEDLSQDEIDAFFTDPKGQIAKDLLKDATTRIIYDITSYHRLGRVDKPIYAATIVRETHKSDLPANGEFNIQVSFNYSDGFGREIQKKIQAEPGPVEGLGDNVDPRWVGSGWTVFNNKGKPVRQYEPFFSTLSNERHRFEFARIEGVSPILFYDPVERVVATLHPNHTFEKVVFDPWQQVTWDVNDTVLGDPRTDVDIQGYTAGYFASLPASPPAPAWQTWHAQRQGGALGAQEQVAANKGAAHANTPTTVHFDTLGRPFLTIADNGLESAQLGQHLLFAIRGELDIEGNQRAVKDERKKPDGTKEQRIVMRYDYDMLGSLIHQASMEAGERWTLNNVARNEIRGWDSRNQTFQTEYDELQRSIRQFVQKAGGAKIPVERLVYGESHTDANRNLRGKLYRHYDQAGLAASESYDFKGNLLKSSRRLAREYKQTVNWSAIASETDLARIENLSAAALEAETFTAITKYDALNRPIQLVTPHGGNTKPNVIQPLYNEANLLDKLDVWLRRVAAPGDLFDPATAEHHAVTNIDYDAKGQRIRIQYGNQTRTEYGYDEETFRLIRLNTTRTGTNFWTNETAAELDAKRIVQNLSYTYDPSGNITHIQDDADIHNVVFFRNQRVDPSNDYKYDAVYRLIQATGREHLGLTNGALNPPRQVGHDDSFRTGLPHPGEGNAVGRYTEEYVYDEVGNILSVHHTAHTATNGDWWRHYAYDEPSLLEPGKKSNRLSSTSLPGDDPLNLPYSATYGYLDDNGDDVHGCMTSMPHLPLMRWDYRDQLQATAKQAVNGGTPETTYYVYDAGGQRVRKVTERHAATGQTPTRMKERVYLGGFEIYREYNGNGQTKKLERESLHITDDKQRIALVETKTLDTTNIIDEHNNDVVNQPVIRYQFSNHLGSAYVELDGDAKVASYEEYYPYGSTAYQAKNKNIKAAAKRYRYSGKERDEESGLYYYGARYYVAWAARWLNPDPLSILQHLNLYQFNMNNPLRFKDATGAQAVDQREEQNRQLVTGAMTETEDEYEEHHQRLNEGGIGKYIGAHGNFASRWSRWTRRQKSRWIQRNWRGEAEDRPSPEDIDITHCIDWAMQCLEAGFDEAGMSETWEDIARRSLSRINRFRRNPNIGRDRARDEARASFIARELRNLGWTAIYFNPNTSNPVIGDPNYTTHEEVSRAGQVPPPEKFGNNNYAERMFSVDIDFSVVNYSVDNPSPTSQQLLQTLKDVPFAFGFAHSGYHTFVMTNGLVTEAHWRSRPNQVEGEGVGPTLERSTFEEFTEDWRSGVIMVPPGQWPKQPRPINVGLGLWLQPI